MGFIVAYPHELLLDESGPMDFSSGWADSCRGHGGHILYVVSGVVMQLGVVECKT